MADDSLNEMPEFGKPEEQIPLVVPDLTPVPYVKPRCIEKNKAGEPCRVPPLKGGDRCLGHSKSLSPELRDKWRKKPRMVVSIGNRTVTTKYRSREELLSYLSARLDMIEERFGSICNPEVEEMICNVIRTMTAVLKVDAAEDVKATGWRMKGSA